MLHVKMEGRVGINQMEARSAFALEVTQDTIVNMPQKIPEEVVGLKFLFL